MYPVYAKSQPDARDYSAPAQQSPLNTFITKEKHNNSVRSFSSTYLITSPRWAITLTDKTVRRLDRIHDLVTEIGTLNSLPSIFRPTAVHDLPHDHNELADRLLRLIEAAPLHHVLVFDDAINQHAVLTPREFSATHVVFTSGSARIGRILGSAQGHSLIKRMRLNRPGVPPTRTLTDFCRDKAIPLADGRYHFLGDPLAMQLLRLSQESNGNCQEDAKALNDIAAHLELLRAIDFRSGDRAAAADQDLYDALRHSITPLKNSQAPSSDAACQHPKEKLQPLVKKTKAPLAKAPASIELKRLALDGQHAYRQIGSSAAAFRFCSAVRTSPSVLQTVSADAFHWREEYEEALAILGEDNPAIEERRLPSNGVAHVGIAPENKKDIDILLPRLRKFLADAPVSASTHDVERHITYCRFDSDHYLFIESPSEFVLVCWTNASHTATSSLVVH